MAPYLQKVILIVLILSTAIPISIGHRENSENESDWEDNSEPESEDDLDIENDDSEIGRYLRDLCSDTKNLKQCWKIITPEINRFTNTDSQNVFGVVIDLALEKSDEIKDKLNQLHQDSIDNSLKKKYISCLINYNDAHQDLDTVKGYLNSCYYQRIHVRVDDVAEELERCKHEFGKNSYDPAHIWDSNREFGGYVEIIKTAMKRFVKEKDCGTAQKN